MATSQAQAVYTSVTSEIIHLYDAVSDSALRARIDSILDNPCPSHEDIARFCKLIGLGPLQTFVLLLKLSWEQNALTACDSADPDEALARHFRQYTPGNDERDYLVPELYNLLSSTWGAGEAFGIPLIYFSTACGTLVPLGLHVAAMGSPDVKYFVDREESFLAIALTEDFSLWHRYYNLQEKYNNALTLMSDANARLIHEQGKAKGLEFLFMETLGEPFVRMKRIAKRLGRLRARKALLVAKPDLAGEPLESEVANLAAAAQRELDDTERLERESLIYRSFASSSGTVSVEDRDNARQRKRRRELSKRFHYELHPDRLLHNDRFQVLAPEKQEELKALYLKFNENIKQHSIAELESAVDLIESYYDLSGLEIPPATFSRGGGLADRILWLEREISLLKERKIALIAEADAVCSNPAQAFYNGSLADPEKSRRNLKEKYKKSKREADALSRELFETFGEAGIDPQEKELI